MKKFITKFSTTSEYENATLELPNVSLIEDDMEVKYSPYVRDYSKEYLTFECLSAGTITIVNNNSSVNKTISYSTDDGSTWTDLTTSTTAQSLGTFAIGDKVLIKGNNNSYATTSYYNYFGGTAQTKVYGNIMSLISGDSFADADELTATYTFRHLFYNCTGLISVENLVLPAETLASYCYSWMFEGCTNLTTAPELPATTLANNCYIYMFYKCTSLTTAPELPATTLATGCYNGMFYDCTSLTTAPSLLPATTSTASCYAMMFYRCTNLTTAPELPATTLAEGCYSYMFKGCTSLNYIKMLATNISAANCLQNWVSGVASTGTFVKNAAATWTTTGVNGIPTGWTVETASA